jgi:hypothetical protein
MGSNVVVELHTPAPLTLVIGVPPCLENARLAAGKDDEPSDICHRRPSILQGDLSMRAYQEGHGTLLVPLQVFADGENLAVFGPDGHV